MDFLRKLFTTSNNWNQYMLIKKMREWQDNKMPPLWGTLPPSFTLGEEFWDKVFDIYRYTTQDGNERAISVWSIYNQIIVTDIIKGNESKVTTNDKIEVRFEKTTGKNYLRIVTVNGKERERRTVPWDKMPKNKKDAEMRYLFNVHTHPPHKVANMIENKIYYSYFSATDLNSLLSTPAIATGLITDKVTFLFKTRETPAMLGLPAGEHPNERYLRDTMKIAEYEADFKTKVFRLKNALAGQEA